jgi:quinol monooxygenase YgiN
MLTLIAYLKAKPEKRDALQKVLSGFVAPTRLEPGCVEYHLHRSADDPNVFMFYEIWQSQEILDEHLKMPYLSDFWERRLDYLETDVELRSFEMLSDRLTSLQAVQQPSLQGDKS